MVRNQNVRSSSGPNKNDFCNGMAVKEQRARQPHKSSQACPLPWPVGIVKIKNNVRLAAFLGSRRVLDDTANNNFFEGHQIIIIKKH